MEKLQPKLRFPEFSGEWSKNKMGDLVTIKSDKHNPIKDPKSLKCIELEHLEPETSRLIGYSDAINTLSIKNKFKKGDILFGKLRPYLKKHILAPFDGVCTSEIWVMTSKSELLSNGFLYQIIINDNFIDIANQSTGSKMPRADWSVVSQYVFNYPSLPEQTKIAQFLTAIDEKLNALKEKKTLLEDYKKGMMQKIFSQEVRFTDEGKDFPDWEEKSLAEVGKTFNGLTGKTKEDFGDGKPYIQYKQIFDNSKINTSKCELVKINLDDNQNKVQFGDVFFTVSSETPNEIGTASVLLDEVNEMYLNSFCFGYRANSLSQLVPEFSRYLFRNQLFRNEIVKLAQGSTRYNMSKVELMKLKVFLPQAKEQTKIAHFLSALDEKIAVVNQQINHTQEYKKGLLQQLFV